MRKNNFVCARCGEWIGSIDGLIECPFCYALLVELEEKEEEQEDQE